MQKAIVLVEDCVHVALEGFFGGRAASIQRFVHGVYVASVALFRSRLSRLVQFKRISLWNNYCGAYHNDAGFYRGIVQRKIGGVKVARFKN